MLLNYFIAWGDKKLRYSKNTGVILRQFHILTQVRLIFKSAQYPLSL